MPRSHVVLAGAGAVGSSAAIHLARMQEVGRITIVDPDTFTEANLGAQEITRADVGKPKAEAVAAKVRRIRRDVLVEALVCRVEDAPSGRLAGDVLIGCLDNRPARATCNQAAFRRSIPLYIDAGVRREHLMARATVCFPAVEAAACHVCGWGPADWEAYQASYTCQGSIAAAATASPSYLCAMAAALAARICHRFVRGELDPQADARQIVYSAELHRSWETTIARNPDCRFDHGRAIFSRLERAPERYTLGAAFDELGPPMAVPGMAFVRRLRCTSCQETSDVLALAGRLSARDRRCPACGGEGVAGALDLLHELDRSIAQSHGAAVLERPLASFGLARGDLLHCGRGLVELSGGRGRKEKHR